MIDLSIVVPIYNVENYLDECLETLYALNIKKEIILVNDESKDNSNIIIKKFEQRYSDETIVVNQKNKGLAGARNTGLFLAKGKYIAFIDSDDFIEIKKYEEFFFNGKNQNLDIMIGDHSKYKSEEYLIPCYRNKKLEELGVVSGEIFFKKSIKLKSFKEEVWDDIYNREFLLKNNIQFMQGLIHEDTLFFIKALLKAKRVKYFNIPIYIYRQREGSIMSSINYKNIQHKIFIINKLLELQSQREKKIDELNDFLLSMFWGIFIISKLTNYILLKKLLNNKKKFSMIELIKIIIISIFCLKKQKIEILETLE